MKKVFLVLLWVLTPLSSFASSINLLSLEKLSEQSPIIIVGHVLDVDSQGDNDQVTFKVISVLKGNTNLKSKSLTITLTSRGGLKDFDPSLKVGENGVFFLKEVNNHYQKAYWGSIAIFNKNNFTVTDF